MMHSRLFALKLTVLVATGLLACAATGCAAEYPSIFTTIKLTYTKPSELLATFGIHPPKPDKLSAATLPPMQIDPKSAIHQLPAGISQAVPFDLDNCIIVKGTQSAIDEFKSMLKKLDIKPKQVCLGLTFWEITAKEFTELAAMKHFQQLKRPYGLLVIDQKEFLEHEWDLYRPLAKGCSGYDCGTFRTTTAPAYYITSALDAKGSVVITVKDSTQSLSGPDGVGIPQLWETICTTTVKPGDAVLLTCADYKPGKSFLVVIQPTIE